MIQCPFCHFNNEDGVLFCEQCKSDLAGAEPVQATPPVVVAPLVEPIPYAVVSESASGGPPLMAELVPLPQEPPAPLSPLPAAPPVVVPPPEPISTVTMPAPHPTTTEETDTAALPTMAGIAPLTQSVAPTPTVDASVLPVDAQPRLLVLRGQRRNVEYTLYEGLNYIGRADEKPVDIDLEDQEPPDRIWCSRQHALITFRDNQLTIEDLKSANGTFVNRARIPPNEPRRLNVNDVILIGNVQMKVII
jgi:pSer/pThr/pTyr-binding forkhead associated (FHA) protein